MIPLLIAGRVISNRVFLLALVRAPVDRGVKKVRNRRGVTEGLDLSFLGRRDGVGGACDGSGGGDLEDLLVDLNVLREGGVLGASNEDISRESEEAMGPMNVANLEAYVML
jgi:hypothetical protein